MKKIFTLIIFNSACCVFNSAFAQVGEWTWVHGSNVANGAANFGIQGIPGPANVPASVYEACDWTDLNGNFWMLGGTASGGFSGDLWKYDPLTNEWTWMKGTGTINDPGSYGVQGVSSPTNRPPARGFGPLAWVDTSGYLWLFSGYGNTGYFNDLWKYDISTNEWTWISGSSTANQSGSYGVRGVANATNIPGSRCEYAASWTDNANDLWLFSGYYNGFFNDLWRYNIASNMWTWMKGSQLLNQTGTYGTMGVEDSTNLPSGRGTYCRWKDNSGNLWFFGGGSYTTSICQSDLWKYNVTTNNWTWMNGSNATNAAGFYGTKCVTSSANAPSSRFEDRAVWTDINGNFWMFGGACSPSYSLRNDLWMYCVSTNQWTWESGDSITGTAGNWGTKGISSATNKPNGRMGAIGWYGADSSGTKQIYLFGGYNPVGSSYNDLWKYMIDPNCGTCSTACALHASFISSDTAFCDEAGKCIDFFDQSTCNPTSWHWSFLGAAIDTSSQQNPTNICYYNTGTYPVTLIVSNSTGTDTLVVSPHIIFAIAPPPPTVTVTGGDTLVSTHCFGYQWYQNGILITGATDSFYIATQGGTYSVQGADSLGCTGISNGILITGLSDLTSGESGIKLYPNPVSDELMISLTSRDKCEAVITDMLGHELFKEIIYKSNDAHAISVNELSDGIYLLQLTTGGQTINRKFVVLHK